MSASCSTRTRSRSPRSGCGSRRRPIAARTARASRSSSPPARRSRRARPIRSSSSTSSPRRSSSTDGPAQLVADHGPLRYGQPSRCSSTARCGSTRRGGYQLDTNDATVDLKTRKMHSGGAVTGSVPQGTFSAIAAERRSRKPCRDARRQCALADRAAKDEIGAPWRIRPVPDRARRASSLAAAARRRSSATIRARRSISAPTISSCRTRRIARSCRAMSRSRQAEMTLNAARMTVAYTGQVVDGSAAGLAARRRGRRHRHAARPDRAQPICGL